MGYRICALAHSVLGAVRSMSKSFTLSNVSFCQFKLVNLGSGGVRRYHINCLARMSDQGWYPAL